MLLCNIFKLCAKMFWLLKKIIQLNFNIYH